MPTDQETSKPPANVETIASGISEVVTAALSVGAAVAKTFAEVTAFGKPVQPCATDEGPIGNIIHYSVETASNLARLVIRSAPTTTTTGAAAATGPVQAYPSVHAGSTLRIPLSIENPTDREMSEITFLCEELIYEGQDSGVPLTAAALKLQPATLTIAPRDFEKLTVFIATKESTAKGSYFAKITVDSGSFESQLRFEVRPPAQE